VSRRVTPRDVGAIVATHLSREAALPIRRWFAAVLVAAALSAPAGVLTAADSVTADSLRPAGPPHARARYLIRADSVSADSLRPPGPNYARTGVMIPADSVSADSLRPAQPSLMLTSPGSAPPRDYLAEVRAGYTPVNRSYHETRVVLLLLGPLYGAIVTLLILFTGLSARFRDIAHAAGGRLYVRMLVYFSLFATSSALLGLPLAWYEEYALEHQYGLSTQSLSGWFVDSVKGLVFLLVMLGVIPLLSLAWRVVRAHPKGWWWRLAAGTAPFALAATILQPLVFDPIFNRFEPLRDEGLSGEILSLGARAGIPAKHVFEVDMSRRTKKINAYVSGFGGSQRIVIWDTMLEAMKRDEILVVMGHEMGHYVLGHVWKGTAMIALGAFAAFWLVARISGWLLAVFGGRWGVEGPGDLAALPVLSLALSAVTLLAQPVSNAVSRRVEHESDVYAIEITRDNDAAARAFLKLSVDNRSNPEPPGWERVLFHSHPPLADRIRFALSYKPWEKGEANRYFRGK
jgi:Zn-dependent protease with chaperone function